MRYTNLKKVVYQQLSMVQYKNKLMHLQRTQIQKNEHITLFKIIKSSLKILKLKTRQFQSDKKQSFGQ